MLEDGVVVIGEEVLDPGGEVRLLAGAAVEAEAHPVERCLVGAPLGLERRRDRRAGGREPGDEPMRAASCRVRVASPQGKAKVEVAGDQKEARWRTREVSGLIL